MGGGASRAKQGRPPKKEQIVTYELTDPDTPTLAWHERRDDEGNVYYENTLSGVTQWEVGARRPLRVVVPSRTTAQMAVPCHAVHM